MKAIRLLLVMSMMVFFSGVVSAQTIEVKGKVTDETGQPMTGVNVLEKGTRNGTVTDVNGEYKLSVAKGKTIVFAFIGCQKVERVVTGPRLDVQLQPDQQALQEVVMVAYGSANNSLQGRIAGLSFSRKQNRGMAAYPPAMPYNVSIAEDNEEYGVFRENRFIPVKSEALSTFSLDVDAASYGNIRRMINQGQMPQKDAVRVEELINYFSYNYPQPEGEHPVNIVTEAAVCPWNAKHQLVRIGVKAREIPSEKLPASNFVFLIDVSGSMWGPQKLDLVKSSLRLLVNNLREKDKVSIVVYAGAAGEVLPATPGSDRQKIREAIEKLSAGGSTAGGEGIQLAYKIAEKNFINGGNNRIILCTDGDFNVGVSSSKDLESLIESKRKSGVYLTVLGYGMGNYKDKKLQILAEKGNGNHAYIDNIQEANKVLVNEFGSTMFTVAKDVKIQVEFNPAQVNAYRLVGYETRLLNKEDFNDDTKDAGELGSGHTVTALYEIVPVGVESNFGNVDDLKYQPSKKEKSNSTSLTDELLTVKLRYKQPESNSSQKIEVPVKASVKEASDDYKFVMAVTMFGQLLRDSDFKGSATYAKVIELARKGLVNDQNGYRREFVRLAESVNQMEK